MNNKKFLMALYTAFVYGVVIFSMASCNSHYDKVEISKCLKAEGVSHLFLSSHYLSYPWEKNLKVIRTVGKSRIYEL